MGVTHSVATEVEIEASPAIVRSVFLDWNRYKEWTQVWTISPKVEGTKPSELKVGDNITANLKGVAFNPVILENSTELFKWNGVVPLLFSGAHSFYFRPSNKTPGGTTMTQLEDFSGFLAFLMKPFWGFEKQTLTNWKQFDQDIKKESERLAAQN
ncbi:activator of hsp90 atpase 1 family protein [Colletotrichum truncatum]|uniref:Activator of hsp90 atpase 1 family protein n=1 Tax=Colletotrichum truncatum TaxID=5467 RepID=A0ACC3ZC67_COLTU|nr:activator of hsp90 atpase 1 family protein [Colletotrichum truncatum]KAF6797670.1 activator of hsp90 atpase 1 family protein [Colletotrichum truncatum]